MDIGTRIHNIIDDRDMKQTTLAKNLKLPLSTLNGYMTGRNQFPCEIVRDIAKELNVTTDYLLGITDIPEPPFRLTRGERGFLEEFRSLSSKQKELVRHIVQFVIAQNQ